MFLYELAIELGKHSTEVAEAARQLGMADVGPATKLDAAQIAALRAHLTGVAPIPPLPPAGAAPAGSPSALPAVPTGPLAADPLLFGEPPSLPGVPVPTAPPEWGPPTPAHATAEPVFDPNHVPEFEAPFSLVEPPSATSEGLGEVSLPPAPPTSWPAPPDGASNAASGGDDGGLGRPQLVALAVAGVVVVALFAFMAINTGPDKRREQAIAAAETAVEPTVTVATTPATSTSTTELSSQDAYQPVNLDEFCRGGRAAARYDERVYSAISVEDWSQLTTVVRTGRAQWKDDVGTLASGAPPINVDDIIRYRDEETRVFDAIEGSGSFEELLTKVDQVSLAKATLKFREVYELVDFRCKGN